MSASDLSFMANQGPRPTYDEIRANAARCRGGCGHWLTGQRCYCATCAARIIAAIRKCHLKANIRETRPGQRLWSRATVDPGGTFFGQGPYLHLPLRDGRSIRVYAPERLRRRLARDVSHPHVCQRAGRCLARSE